ncbi:carbohydrate binding domain-containing protein [Micromonospora sp. FIMYZ51]|uniref:carbohydrate binding domain-containing protein n=1 Tax=Micromonospora sp. FIMYZ51 TaxID=3051832 RepID=UPI00311DF337
MDTGSRQPGDGPPDPAVAGDAAQLVTQLNRLRAWAGQPSLRVLRELAGTRLGPGGRQLEALPSSTTHEVLAGKRLPRLPRLEFVESFVRACLRARRRREHEIETEVERWRQAWRTLADPPTPSAERADDGAAPAPTADVHESAPDPDRSAGPAVPGRSAEPAARGRSAEPAEPGRSTGTAAPASTGRWRLLVTTALVFFLIGGAVGMAGTRMLYDGQPSPSGDRTDRLGFGTPPSATATTSPTQCAAAPPRPAGTELVQDRSFGTGTAGPWDLSAATVDVSAENDRLWARVLGGTANPWDAILMYRGVHLVEGRSYTLSFDLLTSAPTQLRVTVQENLPPDYPALLMRDLDTDLVRCHQRFSFVADRSTEHAEITFQLGGHPDTYQVMLADLSLVEDAAAPSPSR